MSAASAAAAANANPGPGQLAGISRPDGRYFCAAASIMRGMFARKPAQEIAARTGVQLRAAERWLAGTREMGAEPLLRFIASDQGPDFLERLINGLPRSRRVIFWARLERAAKRALKAERMRKLREEIDQLDLLAGPADAHRGLRR